jgi:gamma-glutamyltranspeptidase
VLATQAAVDALREGGNAVDAAVTAAAVLGVTEPFSCGIGGGGFMVVYRASAGTVTTIDGRETAPAAMQPDSLWENGRPLSFNDARYSGLSVGVPGTVELWDEALDRYGTISLANALGPATEVARSGFVVDQTFFDQTQQNVDYFDDIPATAELPRENLLSAEPLRRAGLLQRRGRAFDRRHCSAPAGGADGESHLASRTDDDPGLADVHRTRACADAHQLPRGRRVRHGPALERGLDRG